MAVFASKKASLNLYVFVSLALAFQRHGNTMHVSSATRCSLIYKIVFTSYTALHNSALSPIYRKVFTDHACFDFSEIPHILKLEFYSSLRSRLKKITLVPSVSFRCIRKT